MNADGDYTHNFCLTDLPTNEFCVLLKNNMQKELIETAAETVSKRNYGKYKDLAIYLQKNCEGFSKVRADSIYDRYIPMWKSNKMFIPIDCLLELHRIVDGKDNRIENSIEKIKYKDTPNRTAITFPFIYDENIATISELIKTEGHLKRNLRHCALTNKNTEFINHAKVILKGFGIHKPYENLIIEADIPNKTVMRVMRKDMEFKFHLRKIKNKMKIRFVDKFEYGETKEYEIIFNDNSIINLKIKIPYDSNIIAESSFAICGATICLHITNKTLCKLMNILCEVPSGKKSELIRFSELIFDSPKDVRKAVISAVMSAEGSVEIKERRIRFFVQSKIYTLQLKRLFENFGIKPSISKKGSFIILGITSRNDLIRFSENFNFITAEKNEKLNRILSTYERFIFRHQEGLMETLELLHNHNSLNAYQIANKLNKHKDTAFLHLNKGIEDGLINKNVSTRPYNYFITNKGIEFLGENNVMFRN